MLNRRVLLWLMSVFLLVLGNILKPEEVKTSIEIAEYITAYITLLAGLIAMMCTYLIREENNER